MKSWKQPTPEVVARTVALLSHVEQYRYFFDKLENPLWIGPLQDMGFFQRPPAPVYHEENKSTGFPPWPESRYLARMAQAAPEEVLKVILRIPDTDNVRVHEDLADAVIAMPAATTAEIVQTVKSWTKSKYLLLLPEKLANLAVRLGQEGYTDEAIEIVRSLMAISFEKEKGIDTHENNLQMRIVSSHARFDRWKYKEICEKYLPDLARAGGATVWDAYFELLEAAMSTPQGRRRFGGIDEYCHVWRPAIEDHSQNRLQDEKNSLISCIRDSLEAHVKSAPTTLESIVKSLENRNKIIFRRLALHLIRKCLPESIDLATSRVADRRLFDDVSVRHEYSLLAGESFIRMPPTSQKKIFEWIEAGPDLDTYKVFIKRQTGNTATPDEINRYKKVWERDRLTNLGAILPEKWKLRYDTIVAELGEPQHPEFPSYVSAGFAGPTSPKTLSELQELSIEQIVAFLRGWNMPDGISTPTAEGLGRVLKACVAQDQERFSAKAVLFKGLEPTYVRAVISGFQEATKQRKSLEWGPILELCRWAIEQKVENNQSRGRMDRDPDWGWTRQAIAALLRDGFEAAEVEIPSDQRSVVWSVLDRLAHDDNPTEEHEIQYGGSNMDFSTLSLNTTRGEAMHAVIRYALWLRRQMEKAPNSQDRTSKGFDEMTEVRDTINRHLDKKFDPSKAVRSVFGQWYPWLVLLDRNWAIANLSRVFPIEDPQMFWPAWEAYLAFCEPYHDVADLLKDRYVHAIVHPSADGDQHILNPAERLAEHLMILSWQGKLRIDEPNGLLPLFFEKAPVSIRKHALEYVGRSLWETHDVVEPIVLERLEDLWNKRIAQVRAVSQSVDELSSFGWWFISGKFEQDWALSQLKESLILAGHLEADFFVVEKLADSMERNFSLVVAILFLIVKSDKDGWNICAWREHIRFILSRALQDETTHDSALQILDYLGERGFLDFRDLIA